MPPSGCNGDRNDRSHGLVTVSEHTTASLCCCGPAARNLSRTRTLTVALNDAATASQFLRLLHNGRNKRQCRHRIQTCSPSAVSSEIRQRPNPPPWSHYRDWVVPNIGRQLILNPCIHPAAEQF